MGSQLYSASSKKDSNLEAMTVSMRPSAVASVLAKDWQEVRWTGPPLCEALRQVNVHHEPKRATHRKFINTPSSSSQAVLKCSTLTTICAIWDRFDIPCKRLAICALT